MLAALLLLLSTQVNALELRDVTIYYRDFAPSTVMPELGPFQAKEGLNLGFDVDLVGPLYWENIIRSVTDDGGYKLIGWNFSLGVQVFPHLRVGYEHFSQHLIGHPELTPHFPIYDCVLVTWTIYRGDSSPTPIFK